MSNYFFKYIYKIINEDIYNEKIVTNNKLITIRNYMLDKSKSKIDLYFLPETGFLRIVINPGSNSISREYKIDFNQIKKITLFKDKKEIMDSIKSYEDLNNIRKKNGLNKNSTDDIIVKINKNFILEKIKNFFKDVFLINILEVIIQENNENFINVINKDKIELEILSIIEHKDGKNGKLIQEINIEKYDDQMKFEVNLKLI